MNAMVLCAGYGTRLGDLTREVPKSMLTLGDRPLLEYILGNLAGHGFQQIAVNLHFMPEAIRGYFGDGARCGCRLLYSYEPQLLGTGGGVKKMAEVLGGDRRFLVHYGDVLTNQDFSAMVDFHCRRQAMVTLLVHRRDGSNSALDIDDHGRVVRFLERPDPQQRRSVASPWVFSGVAVCEPELLDLIPAGAACDLPREVFPDLAERGHLFGFALTGDRFAIDSPQRFAAACAAVAQGRFRIG
jgi:NDP-sugar pyrophosphorylase family protein